MTLKIDVKYSLRAPDSSSEMLNYATKLSKMLGEEELIDHSKKPIKANVNTTLLDQLEEKLNERAGTILDTVYGLYSRYAQKVALFVALFIVIINNADSIKYAERIYTDTSFREVLVKSEEKISEDKLYIDKLAEGSQPGEKVINTKLLNSIRSEMEISGLDLGIKSWKNEPLFKSSNEINENIKADFWWWMQKITGLLLTTALVSLGAPFWLDAIKRMVGLKKKNGKQDSIPAKSGA